MQNIFGKSDKFLAHIETNTDVLFYFISMESNMFLFNFPHKAIFTNVGAVIVSSECWLSVHDVIQSSVFWWSPPSLSTATPVQIN